MNFQSPLLAPQWDQPTCSSSRGMPARGPPRRPGEPRGCQDCGLHVSTEVSVASGDASIPGDTSILVDTSNPEDTSHGVQRTQLWGPRADAEVSMDASLSDPRRCHLKCPQGRQHRSLHGLKGCQHPWGHQVKGPGMSVQGSLVPPAQGPPQKADRSPEAHVPPPHQVRLVPQLSGAVSSLCFQGLVPERELPGDPGLRHHHPAPGAHEAAG